VVILLGVTSGCSNWVPSPTS